MLQKGYEGEAIAAFENSIKLDPSFAPAYIALGSAWLAMGHSVQAVPLFERALSVKFPTYPDGEWHKSPSAYRPVHAYLGLAIAYANTGKLIKSVEMAIQAFQQVPDALDEHAEALLNIYDTAAFEWITAGRAKEAYDLLMQAAPLAIAYDYMPTLVLLGTAQVAIGKTLRKEGAPADAADWLNAAINTLKGLSVPRGNPLAEQISSQVRDAERELKQVRNRL